MWPSLVRGCIENRRSVANPLRSAGQPRRARTGHSARWRVRSRADPAGLRRDDLQPAASLARPFTDKCQTPAAPGLTDPRIQHLYRPRGHAMPDTPRTVPVRRGHQMPASAPRFGPASSCWPVRKSGRTSRRHPRHRGPSRPPAPLGVRTDHIAVTEEKAGQPDNPLAAAWWLAAEPQVRPRSRDGRGRGLVYQRARAFLCADRCPSCGRA